MRSPRISACWAGSVPPLCFIALFVAACAGRAQTAQADQVEGKKLSGVGVIIRADSADGAPVFQADGYRIRISAGTASTFTDPLKTLSDIGPNIWIKYEGAMDQAGIVVAAIAEFFPSGYHRNFTSMGARKLNHADDYKPIAADSLVNAEGHFVSPHTKVRLSEAGGPCGWHRVPADQALQDRVQRIGMRLVPAYQKVLSADDPARIPFRFYVVADDRVRSVFACNPGLVLIPKNVVARLQNDDQLAAVLADGVASNLQRQLFSRGLLEWSKLGVNLASVAPLGPGVWMGGEAAELALGYEVTVKLERQRARMALQILFNAGFDLKQAPEAWRLLQPKELPKDLASLKYTREGEYQRRISRMLYKDAVSSPADTTPAPDGNAASTSTAVQTGEATAKLDERPKN